MMYRSLSVSLLKAVAMLFCFHVTTLSCKPVTLFVLQLDSRIADPIGLFDCNAKLVVGCMFRNMVR